MIYVDSQPHSLEPLVLDGKSLAQSIENTLLPDIRRISTFYVEKEYRRTPPTLATLLIGDNPASIKYITKKHEACQRVGMGFLDVRFPGTARMQDIIDRIHAFNVMRDVHGVIVQHPVPDHLQPVEHLLWNAVAPGKDVDGLSQKSMGLLMGGLFGFRPATPWGILRLLWHYGIVLSGKHVVVVGASPLVGKPLSILLVHEGATVTICQETTSNLQRYVQQADILVSSTGVHNLIKASWVTPGTILIDCGSPKGDVEKAAWKRSSAFTPHINGVGPMTVAVLLENVVLAAKRSLLI